MKTPLTQEIDRLTAINAELVAALQAALPYVPHDDVLPVLAVLAKATGPKSCTRACDSCACHEGVVS